jgi:hypothetical protein
MSKRYKIRRDVQKINEQGVPKKERLDDIFQDCFLGLFFKEKFGMSCL